MSTSSALHLGTGRTPALSLENCFGWGGVPESTASVGHANSTWQTVLTNALPPREEPGLRRLRPSLKLQGRAAMGREGETKVVSRLLWLRRKHLWMRESLQMLSVAISPCGRALLGLWLLTSPHTQLRSPSCSLPQPLQTTHHQAGPTKRRGTGRVWGSDLSLHDL